MAKKPRDKPPKPRLILLSVLMGFVISGIGHLYRHRSELVAVSEGPLDQGHLARTRHAGRCDWLRNRDLDAWQARQFVRPIPPSTLQWHWNPDLRKASITDLAGAPRLGWAHHRL